MYQNVINLIFKKSKIYQDFLITLYCINQVNNNKIF